MRDDTGARVHERQLGHAPDLADPLPASYTHLDVYKRQYPTSGGIYWWASKLGGAKAGYYTGWLNLIGLLAIDASVAYGAATFFDLSFSCLLYTSRCV